MTDIATTTRAIDADVAICGAGPVGMALAAMLARRHADRAGERIVLVDGKSLAQASADPRSIALAWGSRLLLEELGAWQAIAATATPIHQIHVSRRGHLGRSLLDRAEHDLEALGYVARYGDVVEALARACERAGVRVLRPLRVDGIEEGADGVRLQLDDGRALQARIAVQAEGGLFGDPQPGADQRLARDYGQSAVIARVSASAPLPHRAFERFTDEGPLALLPQDGGDGHQYALVWCVRPERAGRLLALDDQAFLAELGAAFGERLGRFTGASARLAFPLGLNAGPQAGSRTVAIGNAAQTLHPVAGQGLNLGLRDAAVLARLLAHEMTPAALARFAAQREGDRGMVIRATDTMARAFTGRGPLQALLGLGLAALDTVKPARMLLAELMMFGRR